MIELDNKIIIISLLFVLILGIVLPISEDQSVISETRVINNNKSPVFGEIWNYSSPPLDFNVSEVGVYYNGSFLTCGENASVLCTEETQINGGTYLTIKEAGYYSVDLFVSGEGKTAGGQYGVGLGVNFSIGDRHCYGRVDGTSDANIISETCIEYFAEDTKINLLFEQEDTPIKSFNIYSANLNIVKIN